MFKRFFMLLAFPLISCGCPASGGGKIITFTDTDTVTGTSTGTGTGMNQAKIEWTPASDVELLEQIKEKNACFLVYFKSDKESMNTFMDNVFTNQALVKIVNDGFVPLLWTGPDNLRTELFGVPLNSNKLLAIPRTDNTSYLIFDAFEVNEEPFGTTDKVAQELGAGLTSPSFNGCVEAKSKVNQ